MTISYFNTLCIMVIIVMIVLYIRWINKRINKLESKRHDVLSDKTIRKLIAKVKLVVTGYSSRAVVNKNWTQNSKN